MAGNTRDALLEKPEILKLPDDILKKIFSNLSYHEIGCLRSVCKTFDDYCSDILIRKIDQVEKYQETLLKNTKASLPRRPSERCQHPLNYKLIIFEEIERKCLDLCLHLTKHVACGPYRFVPGKWLDEYYRVLRFVDSSEIDSLNSDVVVNFFDLNTMALEYFERNILPYPARKRANEKSDADISRRFNLSNECRGRFSKEARVKEKRAPRINECKKRLDKLEKDFALIKQAGFVGKQRVQEKNISKIIKVNLEHSSEISQISEKVRELGHQFQEFEQYSSFGQQNLESPIENLDKSSTKRSTTVDKMAIETSPTILAPVRGVKRKSHEM